VDEDLGQLIVSTARDYLTKAGAAALSLDAVAAEAGLTVEQVQTCLAHRNDLLTALIIDAYDASGAAMEQADLAAQQRGEGPGARFLAAARALRAWSLANQAEFALIYGSPVPGYDAPGDTVAPASRTPAALARIVSAALEGGQLSAPRQAIPGPPLVTADAVALFGEVPPEPFADLIERGIVLWASLIGLLAFQVFNRTHDSVQDQAGFFDYAVAVIAESIGLAVPSPTKTP